MSLAELKQRQVADLRGAWTRARTEPNGSRAQNTFTTNRASRSENVRYDAGRVVGRDGYIAGDDATGKMTALYQWLSYDELVGGQINRIVTFENGAIRLRDLVVGDEATAEVIPGAYGATVVDAATRIYAAFYDATMNCAADLRVIHTLVTGTPVDKAFMPPMTFVPTATDLGPGLCTAGLHKIAYIVTSRSGFQGKPSPYLGAIFSPISITIPADRTIRLTINTTWPSDAAFVSAVMTSVETPDAYYIVPDTEIAIPGGFPYTVQIDISITDEDLVTGTILTDHFSYLTNGAGDAPLRPYTVVMLGARMALFTGTLTYFSDQYDFETMTASNHIIQLPGQRQMITGIQLRGVNYLMGPKWTYAVVDNDDDPVTWANPYSVSQALGTAAIHGVQGNTSGDMAWVANEQGLWDFEGAYKPVPVSYMNDPEWKRINWGVALYTLRIVDDTIEQTVYVAAPLDGATDNSHLLTWSYARGRGPNEVDFSLHAVGMGNISSLQMIRGFLTQKSKLWLGPDSAEKILIQDRGAVGNDNGVPFESVWESGEVFKRRMTTNAVDMGVQTVEATVKGTGILRVRVYDKGRKEYEDLEPRAMEELPDDHFEEGCWVDSPDHTVEFKTTAAGERMDLESFTVFYNPSLTNR